MGPSEFGKAPEFPRPGEHPRLLFTNDTIPTIKTALENPRLANAKKAIFEKASTEYEGVLPTPYYHKSGNNKGINNYDPDGLEIIRAKAFSYALYGDKELGYQAIDAMQSYLLTINIRFIFCDQCRAFGNIMYTVACVYDWCYDLLTDDEKHRLRAGTINYAVAGDSGMLQNDDPLFHNYTVTRKMEVGYPPRLQSSFMGHGAERQLTQHYMAGAIAFYDEDDDWWEYVAARYFNVFIPERNALFKCGSVTQGIHYGIVRQAADMWGAFAHKVLFGKNPHDDTMLETVKSAWYMELPNNSFWSDGDNPTKDMRNFARTSILTNSLVMAAIYKDSALLAQVLDKNPGIVSELATPEEIIYASEVLDIIPPENRHEGYPPLYYTPLYLNRMIARREWDNPDSPAVYMKAGELTTGIHEHADAGTFQIFYKELLARDSGIYDWCGCLYSSATIAHNGVTVFNPEKAETMGGKYSGSQRYINGVGSLDAWLSMKKHRVAEREGASYALKDGKTDYAYIASNIAPAYDDDVQYLSRRMLSIFTESNEFPLIFACYDRITAVGSDIKKSVLLHAENEPKIDENRVTLTNGGGKLVATYLSDSTLDIVGIGGENNNRTINGKQMPINDFRGSGWHTLWGRVEVTPKVGARTDDVLSVMFVTDEENENTLAVEKLSANGIIGATIMNNALIFIKTLLCPDARYDITVSGEGEMTYYISGLSAGKWTAEVAGKTVELNVSEDERFARFTATSGNLILKKN